MNLLGKKVFLRSIRHDDMKVLNQMINDSDIEKMVIGWSKPVTESEQNQWYDNLQHDKSIRYAISTVEDKNSAIGVATIRNIDWKNRSASYDIKIIKDYTSKGIGTDTIKTLLNYSFNELNLNRIGVNIIEYNLASRALFEKCGFKLEGTMRESVYKNGKYNSVMSYSILKKEYIVDNEGNR